MVGAVLLVLAGCGGADEKLDLDPAMTPLGVALAHEAPAHRDLRCQSAFTATGCYRVDPRPTYCTVVGVRRAYEAGEFRVSSLPRWADRTIREEGTPQILNFRNNRGNPKEWHKYDVALDLWAERNAVQIYEDLGCAKGTKQSEIEQSEGGLYPNFDPDLLVPFAELQEAFDLDWSPGDAAKVPLSEVVAAESPTARERRCNTFDMTPGCYQAKSRTHYCTVLRIREFYRDGRFEVSDLADWMDPTMRADGAPQVYDFRNDPKVSLVWQDLTAMWRWARRHDMPMSAKRNANCAHQVTQSDMERTEGGPKSFTEDVLVPPNLLDFSSESSEK